MFLELLEEETAALEEVDEYLIDFLIDSCEDGDYSSLKEAFDLTDEELVELTEQMVKRVNSQGQIRKTLSRKIRSRRAAMTTGMSKSQLKIRARKATRTKKRSPMIQRKALRKRRKAMRKRKQFGLK
jgi:cell division GTPase FtsZ